MNEWILAGLIGIGTVVALGAGGWVVKALTRKPAPKDGPKA